MSDPDRRAPGERGVFLTSPDTIVIGWLREGDRDALSRPSLAAFPGSGSARATAFDADGLELGTIASPADFGQHKGILTLEGIGDIASVVWTSSDPFVAGVFIDDLSYTIVPEPGSGSLLGLGMLSFAIRARARARVVPSL